MKIITLLSLILLIACTESTSTPLQKDIWVETHYCADVNDVYALERPQNRQNILMNEREALAHWIKTHPELQLVSFAFSSYHYGVTGIAIVTTRR